MIAARPSALSRAQTESVGQIISARNPRLEVNYLWVQSDGDKTSQPLWQKGGKGLFIREVERAVIKSRADAAVHSLKDVPCDEDSPLKLAAIPPREDVREVLIAREATSLETLPQGATIGTSSPRRRAQLLAIRPDLQIRPLRGNIETRIRKVMESGEYDATILALAGLKRAGLEDRATAILSTDQMLPAAGQGALAVQCRGMDHSTFTCLVPCNDSLSSQAVHAERQIIAGLGCDCHSAIAVLVEPDPEDKSVASPFRLRAKVYAQDGSQCVEVDTMVAARQLTATARSVVKELKAKGALALLGK